MTTADLVYQKIQFLPENLQYQALGYVEELLQSWQKPVKSGVITPKADEKMLKRERLSQLMHEISERGTAFADIDDVIAWQKEVRTDKVLIGREDD